MWGAEQKENNKKVCKPYTIVPMWLFPPCYVYKINQDVSIDKTRRMIYVSVIVRDHEGKVLAIMCYSKVYIIDPTIAKAFITWKAVKFDRDIGLYNIILEDDA